MHLWTHVTSLPLLCLSIVQTPRVHSCPHAPSFQDNTSRILHQFPTSSLRHDHTRLLPPFRPPPQLQISLHQGPPSFHPSPCRLLKLNCKLIPRIRERVHFSGLDLGRINCPMYFGTPLWDFLCESGHSHWERVCCGDEGWLSKATLFPRLPSTPPLGKPCSL